MKTKKPIFEGFRKLTVNEQKEYLKYFNRLIERENNLRERNQLLRFKTKLENYVNQESGYQEKSYL